jgi:hypothetical protein
MLTASLWLDNYVNIAIHYNTYPVEPHFNFLIRKDVPLPWQASDSGWFDHHERGHNRTIWFNRSPTADS